MKKRMLLAIWLCFLLFLVAACAKKPAAADGETVALSDSIGTSEIHAPVESDAPFETAAPAESAETDGDTAPDTDALSETLLAETAEDTTPLLDGVYAPSIEHAERLRGEVNVAYNSTRTEVTLSNQNAVLQYPMNGLSEKSGLTTPGGNAYLQALSEIYIKTTEGKTFRLTDTGIWERMNIYRLGSYYYEVHMLDGVPAFDVLQSQDINIKMFRLGNDISKITHGEDGLSYTVTSTTDPQLSGGTLSVDTSVYNALEITISSTASSSGVMYLAAGPYDIVTAEQGVSFGIVPDGEFHTYIVPLTEVADYTDLLKKIRIDVGTKVGEEVRIRSLKAVQITVDAPDVKLDHTYHLYSDKINDVVRVIADEPVDNLAAVGTITRVAVDTVDKLIIKDKNGTHDTLDSVDFTTAEYVGFDIKGVGVFGMILLPDETSGTLTVTCDGTDYIITREYVRPSVTPLAPAESIKSGARLYTDLNHTFDAFLTTAEQERHPLTGVRATTDADDCRYVGYDVYRGAYRFDISGVNFSEAYDNPERRFIVSAAFEGVETDYPIYVYTWTIHGNLESAALLSDDDRMLPVALQVCKNFQGENEESFYDKGDAAYGEVIFPLIVKAEETTEISVVNLYQNWGQFPLKQISSIQFIAPYYHLSTGSTETNCIAPYYVHGRDYWMLPDFRAMSAPMWTGQPQHASIGRLHFIRYTDKDEGSFGSESVDNIIDAYGPTYADIRMNYQSEDGRMDIVYRHLEYPQWDENRTYYTIEVTVKDTIEIEDFKRDFSFFSFDGREILFKKVGYLNADNECVVEDAYTDSTPRYVTLGSQSPYISFFDGNETDNPISYTNFALIVKDSVVTLGGQVVESPFVFSEQQSGGLNRLSLSMDLGEVTLQAGDTFVIHLVLLPWGAPDAENDDNVRRVREDSCLNPYRVSASVGVVLEDAFLPRIQAHNETAEFTLSGGHEASAVRVYGFSDYTGVRVEERVGDEWVAYELSSDNCDYDGYTVIYDGDGTFSYAFLVNMDGTDRTFRVTAA